MFVSTVFVLFTGNLMCFRLFQDLLGVFVALLMELFRICLGQL